MYITLFGGYVNSDGTATPGHGAPTNPYTTQLFEVDDGGYAGVTAGYVFDTLMPFGLSNFRIEAGFAASGFDDDEGSDASGSILAVNAGPVLIFPGPFETTQSRKVYDWFVRFKGDRQIGPDLGTAFGLELFFRQSEDKTHASRPTPPFRFRNHDVDGFFAGVMAVVQPEYAVSPVFSLVGDFGAGLYALGAEARSISNFSTVQIFNDSDGTVGIRARAKGGLKIRAGDMVSITLFGGVDWWSDVPVADQQRFVSPPNTLPEVKFNDLVELKAGVNLTILLGGP